MSVYSRSRRGAEPIRIRVCTAIAHKPNSKGYLGGGRGYKLDDAEPTPDPARAVEGKPAIDELEARAVEQIFDQFQLTAAFAPLKRA